MDNFFAGKKRAKKYEKIIAEKWFREKSGVFRCQRNC